jgi:hypothetical protein
MPARNSGLRLALMSDGSVMELTDQEVDRLVQRWAEHASQGK